jgi:hypothetical protein
MLFAKLLPQPAKCVRRRCGGGTDYDLTMLTKEIVVKYLVPC